MVSPNFKLTEQAIRNVYANSDSMAGVHTLAEQKVSAVGMDLGTVNFDPTRHQLHMINPLSPMQDVYDTPQVRLQLPAKPMVATIITDQRTSAGYGPIGRSKSTAVDVIGRNLDEAMPPLDFVKCIVVEDDEDQSSNENDESAIYDETSEGLALIVSDFQHFQFPEKFSARAGVFGIKVNHPIELEIPSGVGRLSLGGLIEIDTDNSRELEAYNARLAEYHESIQERMVDAGLSCIQVVTDGSVADRINVAEVDLSIAEALATSNI